MNGSGAIPPGTIQHEVRSAVKPLDVTTSTGSNPLLDLTGYTEVDASNAAFLPASGSTLTVGSPITIAPTSQKTLSEVLLYQIVSDLRILHFHIQLKRHFQLRIRHLASVLLVSLRLLSLATIRLPPCR